MAGVYAMFDGPESPCTQTFGLGLDGMPTEASMDLLESFFRDRGAAVSHEVCPLADAGLLPMLHQRGYAPVESTSVMFLDPGETAAAPPTDVQVRVAAASERDTWTRTAADGWGLPEPISEMMRTSFGAAGTVAFIAELDGQAIASAAMSIQGSVALLAGASTVPLWRRRGAQGALLASRLAYARDAGCGLVMFCAQPGSTSQRNAERTGFRVAYTRTKWALAYVRASESGAPFKRAAAPGPHASNRG